jgi:hypothetical protein
MAKRITVFDREGTVLSTGTPEDVAVPLPTGFGYVIPLLMRSDGRFVGHLARIGYSRNDPETGVKPTDSIPYPFVLFDAQGNVTDTIGWAGRPPPRMWRPPSEEGPPMKFVDVGGQRVIAPRPPSELPWWLWQADGYILVEAPTPEAEEDATITATRIGLNGDTLFHQEVHYAPIRYTDEDLDSVAAWAARGDARGASVVVQGQGPPDNWRVIANRLRAEMDFPEFKNPLQYAWLAQDGGVWLRLREGETSGIASYVLLDPEGRPRGKIDLPENVQVRWNRGDVFWAVVPDEYEVPWVVRFEMDEMG